MTKKLDVDATKLFESMKYQIHVAMDYCHMLEKENVLWIEVFGDVSVTGHAQVEVKNYADDLTDGHENFWNTLNNWLKPAFNHEQFANLILLTTQPFSKRASLEGWNDFSVIQRLETLAAIHSRSEERLAEAIKRKEEKQSDGDTSEEKGGPLTIEPSKSLRLQRIILDDKMRASLLDLLPKIKILTEQPDLNGLIARYKKLYLKSILPERQDEFLNDMFGFMTMAKKITEGWKFEVGEFNKKFAELTRRYMPETIVFPRIDSTTIEANAKKLNVRARRFADKLNEIGGEQDDILQAAADLLHAQQYLLEVIKDYTTSKQDIDDYCENERRRHHSCRKSAMFKCDLSSSHEQLQRASCAFYHGRCAEVVTLFGGYDSTPVSFRNGIYHMLADEEPRDIHGEFHWRLWK